MGRGLAEPSRVQTLPVVPLVYYVDGVGKGGCKCAT